MGYEFQGLCYSLGAGWLGGGLGLYLGWYVPLSLFVPVTSIVLVSMGGLAPSVNMGRTGYRNTFQ